MTDLAVQEYSTSLLYIYIYNKLLGCLGCMFWVHLNYETIKLTAFCWWDWTQGSHNKIVLYTADVAGAWASSDGVWRRTVEEEVAPETSTLSLISLTSKTQLSLILKWTSGQDVLCKTAERGLLNNCFSLLIDLTNFLLFSFSLSVFIYLFISLSHGICYYNIFSLQFEKMANIPTWEAESQGQSIDFRNRRRSKGQRVKKKKETQLPGDQLLNLQLKNIFYQHQCKKIKHTFWFDMSSKVDCI